MDVRGMTSDTSSTTTTTATTATSYLPATAGNIARNNAVTSPPFLHVITTVSESGSHDYDDGDHMMHSHGGGGGGAGGGAGSNSPTDAVPTFPGAAASNGSGSATSGTPKPKRKRSMIACKNCNERRVRCDGATNGCVACCDFSSSIFLFSLPPVDRFRPMIRIGGRWRWWW